MDERREGIFDVVEQFFLLGLGAASLTKEKIEGSVDELIERGRISREEGRRLADDLAARGAREKEAMSRNIREEVGKAAAAGYLATKADVRRLESEIAEIRAHLGMPAMPPAEQPAAPSEEIAPDVAPELSDTER